MQRVTRLYHAASRAFQDRFDTRRLADRIEERIVHDRIDADDRDFIERQELFFLATADRDGRPQCSYKGGAPGFVRVVAEHTIAFPSYDGNGMYLSLGNLVENPQVGLLFVSFTEPKRLRLNGVASIAADDPLLAEWPEAQLVVRVRTSEVFPNCPRYVHRMALVEHSRFVPREACETPVPDWKRREWSRDVLPAGDPAEGAPPLDDAG
jgi:predicted pyridoxine 5'-phosphate oxidase superfamily flavin-nucleotide-binding protein